MTDHFYRAFEERHRGSRELILSRLSAYLPFIAPLKSLYAELPALDLGCGRGEWLELLDREGFTPQGVDLDEGMLQACRALQLPANQGDALQYLESLPDACQVIVSAFHVVEHLGFDQIRRLVQEAYRVLKPGGLLILETPNPENMQVASHLFYLDPTHQRPIPPGLLSFVPEYYGFYRTKIVRLQESTALVSAEMVSLNDVLTGASPDYAVLAQKLANPDQTRVFDAAFSQEYGLLPEALSARFENGITATAHELNARVGQVEAGQKIEIATAVNQLEAHIHQLEAGAKKVGIRLLEVEKKSHLTRAEANGFYRAFEEKYRGPRELVKSRLAVYLPFILPLKAVHSGGSALDLGCGRGEWLELLQHHGFNPHGVDSDAHMLEACKSLNLPATQSDALGYLATLPDESQSVVSAFQVVEHLTFNQLRSLVSEAWRVLKPGGLLIMETPNPENLVVATQNFYLDPTHLRPIPPQLLKYVSEYHGFTRSKIVRLQESRQLLQEPHPSLIDVFQGVSPDYAVVAQKQAEPALTEPFDHAFSKEYGLSLHALLTRHQAAMDTRLRRYESEVQQALATAQQALVLAQHATDQVHTAHLALQSIYASRIWRIVRPVRWAAFQFSLLRQHGLQSRIQSLYRKLLSPVGGGMADSSSQRLNPSGSSNEASHNNEINVEEVKNVPLTRHQKQIFDALTSAIQKNKQG